jgi:hypothetical protein
MNTNDSTKFPLAIQVSFVGVTPLINAALCFTVVAALFSVALVTRFSYSGLRIALPSLN